MAKAAEDAPPSGEQEKDCCRATRARWERRIRAYYASFPVIKDVPCDTCREIIAIRVFETPAA